MVTKEVLQKKSIQKNCNEEHIKLLVTVIIEVDILAFSHIIIVDSDDSDTTIHSH